MVGTLTSSRERLMAVLAAGAAQSDPTQAAEAQVAFDCWMQEQAENFQPDDIAACRDRFEAAMAGLEREPAPTPPPAPPAPMVEPMTVPATVSFDFVRAQLTPGDQAEPSAGIQAVQRSGRQQVGHNENQEAARRA